MVHVECVSGCMSNNLLCHPCQQHAWAIFCCRSTMPCHACVLPQRSTSQSTRPPPTLLGCGAGWSPALASQPCWEMVCVKHSSQPGMTLVQCTLQGTPLHMQAGPLLMAPAQVQPIWLSYSGCATMYDDLVTVWVATTPEWGHAASASVPGSASSGNVPPTNMPPVKKTPFCSAQ